MDTGNHKVIDKNKKSGELNETSETVHKTKIGSSGGPATKDVAEEANPKEKESRVEETDDKTCHAKKGHGKATTSPKNLATSATKNRDVKVGLASSKKPLASSTNRRPSLDGHTPQSPRSVRSHSPTKMASTEKSASRQSGKSHRSSPTSATIDSAGTREHMEQEQSAQCEENLSSSSSPTETGTKPQRTGSLPSYGFTFRCEERAQKRKEFFSKLEEKNHAKELEKTALEEKSKEHQESDIKMLRKSLSFKATPLPSFYHEPAPPKVELKKPPPTRARSPKLGRSKSKRSSIGESEENRDRVGQTGRASLDGRVGGRNQKGMSSEQNRRQSLTKVGCAREHDQIQNSKRWVL